MIQPGLSRITKLLQSSNVQPLRWRAVHVAGTNGKGSICAGISAALHAAGLRCGRYTSPHLVERWDGISVDEHVVGAHVFHTVESQVEQRNRQHGIGATEFEKLTATAFEIFSAAKLDVAVVETGMGGLLDATNVLHAPLVTVISSVGLDHKDFLGATLREITAHKAGIMKEKVSCVVDATNDDVVKSVIVDYAAKIGAGKCIFVPGDVEAEDICDEILREERKHDGGAQGGGSLRDLEPHQRTNFCLAVTAARIALEGLSPLTGSGPRRSTGDAPSRAQDQGHTFHHLSIPQLVSAARTACLPGRLQKLNIQHLTGRKTDVLLDGAHNTQSARVLARYVERHMRQASPRLSETSSSSSSDGSFCTASSSAVGRRPTRKALKKVTYLISSSRHGEQDVRDIIGQLVRRGDNVVIVEFGPVSGMPWIRPLKGDVLQSIVRALLQETHVDDAQVDNTHVDDALVVGTMATNPQRDVDAHVVRPEPGYEEGYDTEDEHAGHIECVGRDASEEWDRKTKLKE
ncbi:MAG: folylpolyglutamate synthase [Lichina confinis]|nr:MAG: folylpolyglutamate synthase [Lichina confinis]